MEKAVVIEKRSCTAASGPICTIKIHANPKCMIKKEENHRRVIYGFFERNSAPSGAEGKRLPG